MEVEVLVRFGGGWHRLKNALPAQLLRNTVYTLEVYGRGADAGVTVMAGNWEAGSATESSPVLRGMIDAAASELPAGARLNEACDTLYIPHVASELRLVLRAEAGSEVIVDGQVRGVSVMPEPVTRGLGLHTAADTGIDRRVYWADACPQRCDVGTCGVGLQGQSGPDRGPAAVG